MHRQLQHSSGFLLLRHDFLLVLLALGFSACAGEHHRRPPAGAMGEPPPPPPKMEAQGAFFDGQIEIETMLAPAGTPWRRQEAGGGAADENTGRHGGFVAGHGGGHRGGWGGRDGSHEGGERDEDQARMAFHPGNAPALDLRLRLTNHGPAPVEVEVVDFNSVLGDFAVQPPKITLPPGQAIEADPMVSRLGVTLQQIPLTVKLREDKRTEQQVLTLRPLPPPKTPEAAPGAAYSSPPAASKS